MITFQPKHLGSAAFIAIITFKNYIPLPGIAIHVSSTFATWVKKEMTILAREPLPTAYRVMTILIDWLICTSGECLVTGVEMNKINKIFLK